MLISCLIIPVSGDIWISAYYTGWSQERLPPDKIDFSAITHIFHFSVLPNIDGTLNDTAHKVTLINSEAVISQAHAASIPVLLCLGGWGHHDQFLGATSEENRSGFVSRIVSMMKTRGYDGIDLDWEPLLPSDEGQYLAFVEELCDTLDKLTPRPLLTAAIQSCKELFASIENKFDQLNIMTYDMSGPWDGWVTWHNSPLYNGGNAFPVSGEPLPSTDAWVDMFSEAGIPINKLGIGLPFYGFVWTGGTGTPAGGVTGPCQQYTTDPLVSGNVLFHHIMDDLYKPEYYHWDENAVAAYLSIDNDGSENDSFVSYDNEESAKRKIEYARNKGVGGAIIYELGCGYRTSMPEGEKDQLLQAVKTAKLNTRGDDGYMNGRRNIGLIRASYAKGKLTVYSSMDLNNALLDILTMDGRKIFSGKFQTGNGQTSNRWTSAITDLKTASGAYVLSIKTAHTAPVNCLIGVPVSESR